MKKVKILLATYNGEKFIQEQLSSILEQRGVEVKVVISDDFSVDRTTSIINQNYPHLNVRINNPGTGSAAKNFLKMLAVLNFDENFEYVALSDQDDIWLPNKLHQAIMEITKHDAQLYCSNLTKWDTSSNTFSELKKDFPQKQFDFLFEGGSAGCTYVFTQAFAKELKEILNKLDFSHWSDLSHDWLIYFLARANGEKVFIDSQSHIHYRLHDANVHGHLNKLNFSAIKEKSKLVLKGYYQKHSKEFIRLLDEKSEAYAIYQQFLGNYFQRNWMIWKYNFRLMRDKKKFIVFMFLNLIKFN